MGQSNSGETHTPTPEELSHRLSTKFARQCFNGVELYSFKDNFRNLADLEADLLYWSEDTLIRFLSIPDCLAVGSVLFQSASYVGAFPFPSRAPAILDFEALVKVVAVFTGRYRNVVKRHPDPTKLLFRSFAIYDRRDLNSGDTGKESEEQKGGGGGGGGEGEGEGEGEYDEDEDEDEDLSLAALEALDDIEVFQHAERPNIHHSRIPIETLTRLIMLLLVIAPLEGNQPIAAHADRFKSTALEGLRQTADNVLRGIQVGKEKGVSYRDFKRSAKRSMPFLFDGLSPLFEHFLFSKNVDMSTTHTDTLSDSRGPLLPTSGIILNLDLLSQMSFFIKGDRLWQRLRLLYAGSEAGFSMGSFETKVLKWTAPTILLVSGTRISNPLETSRERAFSDTLPPRKYPTSIDVNGRVVFGVFINTPWKVSHKDCFGDSSTILFQLEPVHEVFRASTTSTEYAYFNKDDGIAFGSALPGSKQYTRNSYRNLGPVSLTFDESLEFGVFQHVGTGGAYRSSDTRGDGDWQDVFEIEELEVWGCGGALEADEQRKAWAWEEREAKLRQHINLGNDIESDRALLEMAGLIGQNRSGGSMS